MCFFGFHTLFIRQLLKRALYVFHWKLAALKSILVLGRESSQTNLESSLCLIMLLTNRALVD
jgi:hypothetical protein